MIWRRVRRGGFGEREGKDDMGGGAGEQMKVTGEMGEEGGDIGDIKDGCDDEMEGTSVTVTVTM